MEGDTLPNALAALARTRERTLAEVDENLAAKEDAEGTEVSGETEKPGQGSGDDRVALR